jgi:hypothetical protein
MCSHPTGDVCMGHQLVRNGCLSGARCSICLDILHDNVLYHAGLACVVGGRLGA